MRTEFFTLLVNSSQVRLLLITSYIFVEISICICLQHILFIGHLFVLSEEILIQIYSAYFSADLSIYIVEAGMPVAESDSTRSLLLSC